jgi:hypothetical protein
MPFDPQVYRLASIARDKLCREASKASHDLRVLVAHANILDDLLIELNAPRGGPMEVYGFDLLPQNLAVASPRRPVVVTVKALSEHAEGDEEAIASPRHLDSNSSPSSLPMLYHDSESESDSGSDSDSDSDYGDDLVATITPPSPPDINSESESAEDEDTVEPDEGDLGLHRTKSGWRLFGSTTTTSEERQKRKSVKHIDAVTTQVQRLKLTTT